MRDACDLLKMTNCHLLMNSWKKMVQSLFIIGLPEFCYRDVSYKTWLVLKIVTEVFTQAIQEYNVRQNRDFRIPSVNTVYHCDESNSYLGPKIWATVSLKINEFNSLCSFKKEIRKCIPKNYPCRLRKHYISGVSFLP